MQNFMKTILSGVQTWTKGKIKESTADWNQNDSNADNYVKNRTHWDSRKTEAINITFDGVLDGKEYLDPNGDGSFYAAKVSDLTPSIEEVVGGTFSVAENDEVIEIVKITENLIIQESNTLYCIDDGVITVALEDTDVGDGLMFTKGVWFIIEPATDEVPSFYCSNLFYTKESGELKKLDSKYLDLPTNLATTDDVQAVANEKMNIVNPVGTGSFSMNRKSGTVVGDRSHAEGISTTASGISSHAEGNNTTASGYISHAEGYDTTASGNYSHAEGSRTQATSDISTVASTFTGAGAGHYSHAEGYGTVACGAVSHAEGNGTKASGHSSHAEGSGTIASGNYSHAEGNGTKASGYYSHAEGNGTKASDARSHAEGDTTTASGYASHAEGSYTIASGEISHAEGDGTTASSACSHAEGSNTTASGSYSHAEGGSTQASGYISHAEGSDTTASGDCSHAEGGSTQASGNYSHAEGRYTCASGERSHAEGSDTEASGYSSHAEGLGTTAGGICSHVQGTYNIPDPFPVDSATGKKKYAHIVGNGTSRVKRSNAHTLDWDGNAWYQGDVYVGGTDQNDANRLLNESEIATEEDVMDMLSELGAVAPVTMADGSIITSPTGEIYTL